MYIIMEYGPYGDLKKILDRDGTFSEKKAAWMIKRIGHGLAVHAQTAHPFTETSRLKTFILGEGVGRPWRM